jgi:hypothetical protein
MPRRALPIAIWLVAALVLVAHAWHYRGFFVDDAFISLRYAERLATDHGLTWTDGEHVEGYSNLLWVLGCAALIRVGIAGVVAARILGVASALAALAALAWRYRGLPALFACLVLAVSLPLPAWAMGGLEAPLVAAELAWALAFALDGDARASIFFALLCATRPDGALLVAAALAAVALTRGWRVALRMALLPAAVVVALTLFRVAYYGDWVPNTARIKVSVTPERIRFGARYLFFFVLGFLPLLVAAASAIAAAIVDRAARARIVLLASVLVAWLAYVVVIGSDWMPAHRQLVPALVVAAMLAAEALAVAVARGGDWRIRGALAATVVLVVLALAQRADTEAPGGKHAWVWDSEAVGDTLRRAFADRRPLLAVDSAGALSYYSRLPALDLMGLTDRHIATHATPEIGRTIPGHEHGDGQYALSRQPDLVIFCGPQGGRACYRSGKEIEADPRFAADYVPVTVDAGRVRAQLFVRTRGRVGIAGGVIPAYLFADGKAGVARLDGDSLVLALSGCSERALGVTSPLTVDGDAHATVHSGVVRLCSDRDGAIVRALR